VQALTATGRTCLAGPKAAGDWHLRESGVTTMIFGIMDQSVATESTPLPSVSSAGVGNAASKPKLEPASVALCQQAIQQLRYGLSQALLYTEGTKQYERVCASVHAAFEEVLKALGGFKLSATRGEALLNGERLELPASLRSHVEYIERAMSASNTSGLKFEPGLTVREIEPFLQLLARKKFPAADAAKVNAFLRENGIEHIQIEELRYVALTDKDKVYSGEAPVLGTHANAQKNLSELIDATIASIDKVSDTQAQGQLRAELTDQLIEKSDGMLDNVLATASQRLKSSVSEEQAALVAVPQRDARLLLGIFELACLLRTRGMLEDEGLVQALKDQVSAIVDPYKLHAEDLLAHATFEESLQHLLPRWLLKARASLKGGSAAERWEGILSQSPKALLDEQMFTQIVDVLDELMIAAMDSEAEQLAKHIAGALRSHTKRERSKAVERLSYLLERSLEQASPALRLIEDALLEACRHETCDEVMKLLLTHLSKRCVHHYAQKNYQRSMEHLDGMVQLEESSRVALKDEGANLARQAREALSMTELAVSLPQDVLEEGEQGEVARKMIKLLGPGIWVATIARLRFETDEQKCLAIARHLKELGPEAVKMFYTALGRENEGPVALRFMALSPEVGDENALWEQVPSLLLHPDGQVGTAALAILMQRDGEEAVEILCSILRTETDPERRKVWIAALSRLQHLSAQQVLLGELDEAVNIADADAELLMTILEALSAARNGGVVRTVAALLQRNPAPSKPVQLCAIRSLAPFYTDPLAVETLERARKSKDPEIARLALACRRGLVAAEQQMVTEQQQMAEPEPQTPPPSASPGVGKTLRKTRRGFEALEREQIDDVFQVGVAIGQGAAPAAPAAPAAAPVAAAPGLAQTQSAGHSQAYMNELKATLEGRVQDLGLAITVRIVGSKDGMLRIFLPENPEQDGRIFIRGKRVQEASYNGKSGMQALHALDRLKGALFAYYPANFTTDGSLDIECDKVQDALVRFRDQQDDQVFF